MTNAVLLSAGQGRRLGKLTEGRPKCTVVIGGKSLGSMRQAQPARRT